MTNEQKIEALTNEGMIDQMYHELTRFQQIRSTLLGELSAFTRVSTWQRWIRK